MLLLVAVACLVAWAARYRANDVACFVAQTISSSEASEIQQKLEADIAGLRTQLDVAEREKIDAKSEVSLGIPSNFGRQSMLLV
jgi:hypothetical protein